MSIIKYIFGFIHSNAMQTNPQVNTQEVYSFFGIEVYLTRDGAQMVSREGYDAFGRATTLRQLNDDLKTDLIKL